MGTYDDVMHVARRIADGDAAARAVLRRRPRWVAFMPPPLR